MILIIILTEMVHIILFALDSLTASSNMARGNEPQNQIKLEPLQHSLSTKFVSGLLRFRPRGGIGVVYCIAQTNGGFVEN